MDTSPQGEKSFSLKFHGEGFELFGIYLTNALFTLLTLGIYSFWAKLRTRKFFYENTEFLGERFSFHATGGERFIGFLKAIGMFAVFGVLLFLLNYLLAAAIGEQWASTITSVLFFAALVALSQIIAVGRERYRLSRTSWRNLRFRFTGKTLEIAKISFVGTLLSVITLGLYLPWFSCQRKRFFTNNSYFGTEPFQYDGDGFELFKIDIVGLLLTVVTMGIYSVWWTANARNYHWQHTSFQGKRLEATLTGGQILVTAVLSFLLVVGTLGLGIPFAAIMRRRLLIENLAYPAEPDLEVIKGKVDAKANALADGMGDVADALESVSDIFT